MEEAEKDLSEERCSSLLDDIIQTTEELSALDVNKELQSGLTNKIRASGITLWNRAVSLKTQELANTHLIARSTMDSDGKRNDTVTLDLAIVNLSWLLQFLIVLESTVTKETVKQKILVDPYKTLSPNLIPRYPNNSCTSIAHCVWLPT